MPLRFVLDEHRFQPLDAVRVGDPPDLPLGTLDPDLLIWSEREGRILLSRDYNSLPAHFARHLQAGRHPAGILLLRPHTSLSLLLGDLIVTAQAGDAADFQDAIRIIPF